MLCILRHLARRSSTAMAFRTPPEVIFRNVLMHHKWHMASVSTVSGVPREFQVAVVRELGRPMVQETRPMPTEVADGHVLLEIEAAGVNFADILKAAGQYQVKLKVPYIPGAEVCGCVKVVGSGVTNVKVGDKIVGILGLTDGAMAEYTVANSRLLIPVPDLLPSATGASMLVSYGTAMMALTHTAKVQAGETVLVTAGAGSTGLALLDIATNVIGAKVISVCGGPEKCALARSRGSAHTIDYNNEKLRDRVKEITGDRGVDVVMDQVGGDIFIQCLKSIAQEGRLVTIGYASGKIPSIPANLLLLKMCSVHGLFWGNTAITNPGAFIRSIDAVMNAYKERKISPYTGHTFPLSQANEAFDLVKSRKSSGKVVIVMKSDL